MNLVEGALETIECMPEFHFLIRYFMFLLVVSCVAYLHNEFDIQHNVFFSRIIFID